jgi:hypothetical protein
MRSTITVEAFEAAERELVTTHARKLWRIHAVFYALAIAAIVLLSLFVTVAWFVYFGAFVWGALLWLHFVTWVRHGDARVREQQVRIEWRAGRSREHLIPRGP